MPNTTADYLAQAVSDKHDLVTILNNKGVTASDSETFTELVPKVDTIPSGASADGTPSNPFIINRAADITIQSIEVNLNV